MSKFTFKWADLPSGPEDGSIVDPTPEQVDNVLEVLAQGNVGFAILSSGDQQYLQTSAGTGKGNDPFQTEYRAGSADAHFILEEGVTGSQRLKQLFRSYMTDPKAISRQGRWAPWKF